MLTNDGRCTCGIKSRNAMAKAAFHKKRALFNNTLDLKLRKKLVKCYVWSTALSSSLVFSLWAGFGRNQNPVRRPVWLWHTAF
jgi:hypothetical protein